MRIDSVHNIKGRGLAITCMPSTRPDPGSVLRHHDGRAWLITAVDIKYPWQTGRSAGLFLRGSYEGQPEPAEGEEVEMVEPLTLVTLLAEAEHNVCTLTVALAASNAERARLGAEAADARWDLTP